MMIAKITGLEAWEFVHTIGDAHIYMDAIAQCKEQLRREPKAPPYVQIRDCNQKTIDDFVMDDFELINYQSFDAIKAKMAV
jgi:thymidylate synthase